MLTWQAGYVQVKADVNKNIRPVKEERGSHKAIDGIVAAIMALSLALFEEEPQRSIYETRGFAFIYH